DRHEHLRRRRRPRLRRPHRRAAGGRGGAGAAGAVPGRGGDRRRGRGVAAAGRPALSTGASLPSAWNRVAAAMLRPMSTPAPLFRLLAACAALLLLAACGRNDVRPVPPVAIDPTPASLPEPPPVR